MCPACQSYVLHGCTCYQCSTPAGNQNQSEPVSEQAALPSPVLPSLKLLSELCFCMHGFQGISLPLADPEACCIALESLQACLCKQLPVPAVRCTASLPKRKEKETLHLLGVSSMKNQVLYRAAQELAEDSDHRNKLLFLHQSILQAMQTLSRTSKVCLVNKLKH